MTSLRKWQLVGGFVGAALPPVAGCLVWLTDDGGLRLPRMIVMVIGWLWFITALPGALALAQDWLALEIILGFWAFVGAWFAGHLHDYLAKSADEERDGRL